MAGGMNDGASPNTYDCALSAGNWMQLPVPTPMADLLPPAGLEHFFLFDEPARLIRFQLPHASVLLDSTLRTVLEHYFLR